jgi:hypothetical protein
MTGDSDSRKIYIYTNVAELNSLSKLPTIAISETTTTVDTGKLREAD